MTARTYRLDYRDVDEFIAAVGVQSFRQGQRIHVRLSDNTDYVFTYISSNGDQINGKSALNGNMIYIDLNSLTLYEQA